MFMNRRFFRPFLVLIPFLILTAAPSAFADDLPTLEQILDRYVDVLGGRENLAKHFPNPHVTEHLATGGQEP
jgi:hypothetical protein